MTLRNRLGGRPKEIRNRITKPISFESDRFYEFQGDCDKENISVSYGVRELVDRYLEAKALNDNKNPINISYTDKSNDSLRKANTPTTTTLDQWIRLILLFSLSKI